MSKRKTSTSLIELAETHNIALAISRVMSTNGDYSGMRWRRALLHGMAIAGCSHGQLERVRVALELP